MMNKTNSFKKPFVAVLIVACFSVLLICSPFVIKKSLGSILNSKLDGNLDIIIQTPGKVLLGDPIGWEQYDGAIIYDKNDFIVTIYNNESNKITDVKISLTNNKEVNGSAHGIAKFTCDDQNFTIPKESKKSVKCYGAVASASDYKDVYETITYSYNIDGNFVESKSDAIYFYHVTNPTNLTNDTHLSELEREINSAQSKADLVDEVYYDKTDINNAISNGIDVYKNSTYSDEVVAAINDLKKYTDSTYAIPEIKADYTNLDETLDSANKIVNEVPNYSSLALYTDYSWKVFSNARDNANNLSRNYTKKKQGIVNNAKNKLDSAMKELKYHDGYYDSLKKALSALRDEKLVGNASDLSNISLDKKTVTIKNTVYNYYSEDSWKNLENAIKNIDASLLANNQDKIEKNAKDVSDAYQALVKAPAVYDDVTKTINDYLNSSAYKNDWYTLGSKNKYESYVYEVVKYDINTGSYITILTIDKQNIVDGFAANLNNIKLDLKSADYSSVTDRINNYLNSDAYKNHWYTTDSKNTYESYITNVINYDIKDNKYTTILTIDNQNTVDDFAKNLNSIKLNLKNANYSSLTKIINDYLNSSAYKNHWLVNGDEEAINGYITNVIKYNIGDQKYNEVLTIVNQSVIDNYVSNLSNLINNAKYKLAGAKYDELTNAINSFKNSEAWVNDWYTDSKYKTNVISYVNGNYDKTITINNSSKVDTLINDFNNNVSKLCYKKADGYMIIDEYKDIFNNLSSSDNFNDLYNVEARQYIYDYLLIFNDNNHSKMNITINNQSKLDDFINGIKDFYSNIDSYKNTANYSGLNNVLNSMNSNLYTDDSWSTYINSNAYTSALDELNQKRFKYDEQDKVNELINNLINARNVLVFKGADYTEFINTYTSFITSSHYNLYTYKSKKLVKDYYNEKTKTSLDVGNQELINSYTDILKNRIKKVNYKPTNNKIINNKSNNKNTVSNIIGSFNSVINKIKTNNN